MTVSLGGTRRDVTRRREVPSTVVCGVDLAFFSETLADSRENGFEVVEVAAIKPTKNDASDQSSVARDGLL